MIVKVRLLLFIGVLALKIYSELFTVDKFILQLLVVDDRPIDISENL